MATREHAYASEDASVRWVCAERQGLPLRRDRHARRRQARPGTRYVYVSFSWYLLSLTLVLWQASVRSCASTLLPVAGSVVATENISWPLIRRHQTPHL